MRGSALGEELTLKFNWAGCSRDGSNRFSSQSYNRVFERQGSYPLSTGRGSLPQIKDLGIPLRFRWESCLIKLTAVVNRGSKNRASLPRAVRLNKREKNQIIKTFSLCIKTFPFELPQFQLSVNRIKQAISSLLANPRVNYGVVGILSLCLLMATSFRLTPSILGKFPLLLSAVGMTVSLVNLFVVPANPKWKVYP